MRPNRQTLRLWIHQLGLARLSTYKSTPMLVSEMTVLPLASPPVSHLSWAIPSQNTPIIILVYKRPEWTASGAHARVTPREVQVGRISRTGLRV
ncbi:hypothetical protein TorRG33x02_268010 [Trema orientale]|uniref:Uncharacterized protein n=1 Tax=Trema orientale TaxID=63057 RepID=A0A2P5CZJ1_TREOI|nr:hypothetical protein TorRG33x02_268010 [Trema orientale]